MIPVSIMTVSFTFFLFLLVKHISNKNRAVKKIAVKIIPLLYNEDYPLLEETASLLIQQHFIYKVVFKTNKKQIIRTRDIYSTRVKIYTRQLFYKNKEVGFLEIAYS